MIIEHEDTHGPWSTRSILLVITVLLGVALTLVLATAPLREILGPSSYAFGTAIHGTFSFMLVVVSTIALYLGLRLFAGRVNSYSDLQLLTLVMSILSFLTIVFGNWIYIPYRSADPNSAKSFLMAHSPKVHSVFFEFKEYTALFTLPLSVAAAFIIWKYRRQVLEQVSTRNTVAVLIALYFFYFVVAFVLGAAITKIRPI